MTLPPEYFDALYADSGDPWGFTERWYESRKRALTLALLPEPAYASGYEPGCSIGVLTRELAGRCGALLAHDVSAAAVEAARARCADLPHVQIEVGAVPGDWPPAPPALVVLSEVGYYLDVAGCRQLATLACRSPTVLAVHWRHEVADYPLGGDTVHEILTAAAAAQGLTPLAAYRDEDLVAAVWTRSPLSVATGGGLT